MPTIDKTCGDSLMQNNLFQQVDGGIMPTSPLQFMLIPCKFTQIKEIFRQFHYKKEHMGGGISYCFALVYKGDIVAGAVIGKMRHDKNYSKTLEIRRLACLDSCPKNTESYFLGKIIWWLKKNTDTEQVISYSDLSVGHTGTIYKASNFKLIGELPPVQVIFWKGSQYHPRSLTIHRPYSYKLREAVKTGEAKVEIGKPKLIYSYKINRG